MGGRGGAAPLITLTTDFGLVDPFVGIMKGVIAGRAPGVPVVDVSHGVPPQDVRAGALVLYAAVPYFPPRTIHVAVVDPGVGSERRALCIETTTALLLGPDNGVLSLAAPSQTVRRVVAIENERFFLSPRSRTFHGRDVFAPVAAALATGTAVTELGPTVMDPVRLSLPVPRCEPHRVSGEVIYVDRYGNLVTNVAAADLPSGMIRARLDDRLVGPLVDAYAAVAPGAGLGVIGSWGLVEIAVRDGSAQERFGARVGSVVALEVV